MHKFGIAMFAGLMLGALGCDDGPVDTAGNAAICNRICRAVDECSEDTDISECTSECREESEDDGFEERAEQCSDCIKRDNECIENVVECADECAGVVALSAT